MTSRTGMSMRSGNEGACGNNALLFQSCDGSSYCTALGETAALILSPANCEIPVLSYDGADNSLKAEPMCTTKTTTAVV